MGAGRLGDMSDEMMQAAAIEMPAEIGFAPDATMEEALAALMEQIMAVYSVSDDEGPLTDMVERFLRRNPTTSVVAEEDGKIVGSILCGHDGRRGCLYHVCVHRDYRMRGIGKAMVVYAMNALKAEEISKVSLIAFTKNDIGNAFWNRIGWTRRLDLNYYDFTLNEENIVKFNE